MLVLLVMLVLPMTLATQMTPECLRLPAAA